MQRTPELDARLRMAMAAGLGPKLTARLEQSLGSPVAAADASVAQLREIEGVGPRKADEIRRALDACDVESQWRLIDERGVALLAIDDARYPALLKHIPDPPPLLFVRGSLEKQDAVGLGVVGSRKCSAYGREQADRFSAGCSAAGLTIVSGGARGIDTAGHRAAMRVNGRTVAVLGCGLAQCYPPENAELFDWLAGSGRGAVVSELPMNAPPIAENFPRRNRIISGLSLGVLVVEAATRSGALITARLAVEEHHREVMAVPGRVDSQASAGCHKIIREGWATLVTNTAEVLQCLGETGQLLHDALPPAPEAGEPANVRTALLTEPQRHIIEALGDDAMSIDQLTGRCGLPVGQVQGQLTLLQLRGMIERVGGNQVRKRR
ncbi:MAG: DNA-processing protein DprA [Phycisphaerales bacterium]